MPKNDLFYLVILRYDDIDLIILYTVPFLFTSVCTFHVDVAVEDGAEAKPAPG